MFKEFAAEQKRVSLEDIKRMYKLENYTDIANCIKELMDAGRIKPVKASKTNGKKPALFNEYHVIRVKKDYSDYIDELKYKLSPSIDNGYYLKNLERYVKDRERIREFNQYIVESKDRLRVDISLNERSYDIWKREKYLKLEGGKSLLKNLRYDIGQLGVYDTMEPIAYYSHNKLIPQNVIIIENKDTFYSMRRQLLQGHNTLLGVEIGTLIYGAGKGIVKAMEDLEICVEPYIYHHSNHILYFGDLDYEGIGIYEVLYNKYSERYNISLYKQAYEAMIDKVIDIKGLPDTKKGQNKNIGHVFLDSFDGTMKSKMVEILECGKYIPQEILNITDF